ncbi:late competence development ComFB family protein [Tumidithrix elongata RA019]|uniref:Late competence development ComFB family protein n=1 Tax=Tumidithrix elongata BACA0141 TaxID=2716417 RepID=A0AAW9Q4Z9_9CYAN|nr:late competence development ComFB family protein [Tumidithrix elongata RA019]
MGNCRNAIEELVIAEAETQIQRLGPQARERVDLSEVIAYALNRLPPMYATTHRGWTQQRQRASSELANQISAVVRNGLLGVQRDTLRQLDPLPNHELASQTRTLVRLQQLLKRKDLKWKDVPGAVNEALMDVRYQGSLGSSYLSLDRRNAVSAKSYLKRKTTQETSFVRSPTAGNEDQDFESYMSGTAYRYSNILENLVTAIAERRMERLSPELQAQINLDEVLAYALNRLPPMYATSNRGLKQLRQQVKTEMTNEMMSIVKQAFVKVAQAPARVLSPLPFERYNLEQDESLEKLKVILKRDDVTWRNVVELIEEAILKKASTPTNIWTGDHIP